MCSEDFANRVIYLFDLQTEKKQKPLSHILFNWQGQIIVFETLRGFNFFERPCKIPNWPGVRESSDMEDIFESQGVRSYMLLI